MSRYGSVLLTEALQANPHQPRLTMLCWLRKQRKNNKKKLYQYGLIEDKTYDDIIRVLFPLALVPPRQTLKRLCSFV